MDIGENGNILVNLDPNPTGIEGNQKITRTNSPNSDKVQGIAPITEIEHNLSKCSVAAKIVI